MPPPILCSPQPVAGLWWSLGRKDLLGNRPDADGIYRPSFSHQTETCDSAGKHFFRCPANEIFLQLAPRAWNCPMACSRLAESCSHSDILRICAYLDSSMRSPQPQSPEQPITAAFNHSQLMFEPSHQFPNTASRISHKTHQNGQPALRRSGADVKHNKRGEGTPEPLSLSRLITPRAC
jgi:hypothetical protein